MFQRETYILLWRNECLSILADCNRTYLCWWHSTARPEIRELDSLRNAFSTHIKYERQTPNENALYSIYNNVKSRTNDTWYWIRVKETLFIKNLNLFSKVTLHAGYEQYAIHLRTRRVAVLRLHCVKITMVPGLENGTMELINNPFFFVCENAWICILF